MTRIKSTNVQLGSNFVLPIEQETKHDVAIEEALEKSKQITDNANIQAQQIVEQAKSQAAQLLEEAKQKALSEVDAIKNAAHQEGFDAGHQEGLDKAVEEMTEKVNAVDIFAQSNFQIKDNIVKSAELDIVQLVIEIAQKVCGKMFELDENIVKEITLDAIRTLKDKESITIIVNPELASTIYSISDELKQRIPQLENIKIIEDNSVSPDGTIVESPLSRVDCRVRSQINEIAEKLMQGLNNVH